MQSHHGRDPEKDDGLRAEDLDLPDGRSVSVYKATWFAVYLGVVSCFLVLCSDFLRGRFGRKVWSGPKGVWELHVEEVQRVSHKRMLDNGMIKQPGFIPVSSSCSSAVPPTPPPPLTPHASSPSPPAPAPAAGLLESESYSTPSTQKTICLKSGPWPSNMLRTTLQTKQRFLPVTHIT